MQLDPALISQLGDLELAGRLIAEGYLFGGHAGRRLGQGVDFSQYRPYDVGDDPRRIDWRRFSRTGRAFVVESELEADYRIWLIIDDSASMRQQSVAGHWSKLEYAKHLAAALGYIAHRQDDQLGLVTIGESPDIRLAPAAGRRQWYALLSELDQLKAHGRPPKQAEFLHGLPKLWDQTRGSLVLILSDFYQDQLEIEALLSGLVGERCEALALCLEGNDELFLPDSAARHYQDMETGQQVITSGSQAREEYQQNREDYLSSVDTRLARINVHFHRLNVDQPMDHALRGVLQDWRFQQV